MAVPVAVAANGVNYFQGFEPAGDIVLGGRHGTSWHSHMTKCRKCLCVTGAILLRGFPKMTCSVTGRRNALGHFAARARRSRGVACAFASFADRIGRAASSGDSIQIAWQAWDCAPRHSLHSTAPHSTLHTLHSTLYTPQSTLHFTLRTSHFTFYTPHVTLQTLHCTALAPRSTRLTPHFRLQTLHSTLYIPHSTLHTPHLTLHCTLHTLQATLCTFYTPHFTLHTAHSTLQPHLTTSHPTLSIPNPMLHTLHLRWQVKNV